MEQAREWPQSLQHSSRHGTTVNWPASSLRHPSAGEHAYKVGVMIFIPLGLIFISDLQNKSNIFLPASSTAPTTFSTF